MSSKGNFTCPKTNQHGQQPCGDGVTAAQAANNLCTAYGKAVLSFSEVPGKACSGEYGQVNVCCSL
jgi:hypothetical protein